MHPANPRARILVVDDNAVFAKVLFTALGDRGYTCAIANSMSSAMRTLETFIFDVVLTDLHFAGGDGVQLLQAVQSHSPRIVRILMSGSLESRDAAIIGHSVLDAYVRKPFELQTICDLIDQKMEERKRSAVAPQDA